MSITVEEALTIGAMRKCKLIGGKAGLQREVRCIDTMEIPDIYPWLQKHELLMTTGYSIRNNDQTILELLHHLNDVGGAGLAITTHFIGDVPSEAIALADELRLPLIKIPSDVPFIELTNPLMKAIVDKQNKILKFSESMNKQFIDLEINGGGFQEIANVLGELSEHTVVITNPYYEVLAVSNGGDKEILLKLLVKSDNDNYYIYPKGQLGRKSKKEVLILPANIDDIHLIVQKVLVRKRLSGYIILAFKGKKNDEYKNIALYHAAVSAALEFSKMKTIETNNQLLDNNLFLDLIIGNISAETEAADQAKTINWPVLPVRLAVTGILKVEKKKQGKPEEDAQIIKEKITSIIRNTLLSSGIICVAVINSDRFICIFSDIYPADRLAVCFNSAIRQVAVQTGFKTSVGISLSQGKYTSLPQAYKECCDAIQMGNMHNINKEVIFVQDVLLEMAFKNVGGDPFFTTFVDTALKKLREFDNDNDTCLLATLEALFDNMGIRSATAEQLFLHRNTLSYRLKKIESLTGRDLNNSRDLLTLGLAAKLSHYI